MNIDGPVLHGLAVGRAMLAGFIVESAVGRSSGCVAASRVARSWPRSASLLLGSPYSLVWIVSPVTAG